MVDDQQERGGRDDSQGQQRSSQDSSDQGRDRNPGRQAPTEHRDGEKKREHGIRDTSGRFGSLSSLFLLSALLQPFRFGLIIPSVNRPMMHR